MLRSVPHRRRRWLLAALAVAVLAAGCGSDDGPSGAQPPTTTTEQAPAPTTTARSDADLSDPAFDRMGTVAEGSASEDVPDLRTPGIADPQFMRAAFESAQEMWRGEFNRASLRYVEGHLVFFGAEVSTACGVQSHAVGPFYCPADRTTYLNTGFFRAIAHQYGLRSGFAAGYITAHELGHHVQNIVGVLGRVAQLDQQDPSSANARSVRVELQADCYAGMWLHAVARQDELSQGDLEDIVHTAAIVGSDYQQKRAGGILTPETWTHGSSAQRVHWLGVGLHEGNPVACDTFTNTEP